ncbi:MAG: DUF1848 domain-containing protein [Tannerellaceae bacterium]|jgi:hypothetical protein|nr:DUF1848 domain-containing protein [Tannerellaceae bacterium]
MTWESVRILTNEGEQANAIAPLIVSAGRSTDIPAFMAPWLMKRLDNGYAEWRNPFNGNRQLVAFNRLRVIIFWSKNPLPLTPYIQVLEEKRIKFYLHFTLNDYEREGLEPSLPLLGERIDIFRRMVDSMGFGHVIWRFDPLILACGIGPEALLERIARIASRLGGYTEKLVFSFADLGCYRGVRARMARLGAPWRDFEPADIEIIGKGIGEICRARDIEAATCAEEVDLSRFGIEHNSCVDRRLLSRLFTSDEVLMRFISACRTRDSGQRKHCGCIPSKDIGRYGSCGYSCAYCYARGGGRQP